MDVSAHELFIAIARRISQLEMQDTEREEKARAGRRVPQVHNAGTPPTQEERQGLIGK